MTAIAHSASESLGSRSASLISTPPAKAVRANGEPAADPPPPSPATSAPRSGSATSWRTGALISVLLHGGLAVALLFGVSRIRPPSKAEDSAMTVELAPSPSAPTTPPQQIPPGPKQIRAVAKPVPIEQPKIPLPPPSPALKPEVEIQSQPQPMPDRPVQKTVVEQTTAPQAVSAPAKPEMAAPTAGASSVASNAPQTWESSLLAKLQRNKRYPDAAQSQGQQDVVYVRIAIARSGRVVDASIARSRGFSLLDNEVINLVHRSSPFAAPPAQEEGDPVVVVVPVEFFITRHGR